MMRSFSSTVGLRRAAAIIFALVAVLPMLAVLPVLHTAGVLASPYAQVSLLLAVGLAVLGFFVLRRLTDEVARLAEGFANPTPTTAVPAATVPGLGRVTEIGQIGDALTHMLNDLRASTDRLEDLVFKLSTLNEVVELAARIPQLQDLLALVLERTMRTVRASIGSIMLLDHERQVLRVVVARGLPDDVVEHAEVAVGESIAGKVVQLGEPVLVEDIATDPRFARTRDPKYGSGAFMCLPVRVEDRIIGVVNLAKSAAAPPTPAFSPTDLQFLNTLMTHIAYAVDNARLLQEAQLSTNRLRRAMEDLRTTQTRIVEGETLRAVGQMASGMAHHVNNLLAVISGRVQLLLGRSHPAGGAPAAGDRPAGDVRRRRRRAPRARLHRRAAGDLRRPPVDLNEIVREVVELTRPRWRDEAQMRSAGPRRCARAGRGAARDRRCLGAARGRDESPLQRHRRHAAERDDSHHDLGRRRLGLLLGGRHRGGMSDEVRAPRDRAVLHDQGAARHRAGPERLPQRHAAARRRAEPPAQRGRRAPWSRCACPAPRPWSRPRRSRRRSARRCASSWSTTSRPFARRWPTRWSRTATPWSRRPAAPRPSRAWARARTVDLVFTDLGMPEMTGWDVARAVRSAGPGCPVVLVTGWAVALEMSDEERRGVDFVLAKPYTVETLRSALAAVRLLTWGATKWPPTPPAFERPGKAVRSSERARFGALTSPTAHSGLHGGRWGTTLRRHEYTEPPRLVGSCGAGGRRGRDGNRQRADAIFGRRPDPHGQGRARVRPVVHLERSGARC